MIVVDVMAAVRLVLVEYVLVVDVILVVELMVVE